MSSNVRREYGASAVQSVADVLANTENSGECLLWLGSVRGNYGGVWVRDEKRQDYAHRYVYEQEHGPIPDGMTVDHLCRVKLCVNGNHLEVVTYGENTKRATDLNCRSGHPRSPENTYVRPNGWRECRVCIRSRSAA